MLLLADNQKNIQCTVTYVLICIFLTSLLCNAAEVAVNNARYPFDENVITWPILKNICLQLVGNDPDEDFKQLLKLRQVSKYFTQREFTENVIKQLVQEKYPATDDILGTHGLSDSAALLVYCSDPAVEWSLKKSNLYSQLAASTHLLSNKILIKNIMLLIRTKMQGHYDIYENFFKNLSSACKYKVIANHLLALLHEKYRKNEIAALQKIQIPQERYNEFLILYSLLADETCKTIALYRAVEAADLQKVAFLLQNGADCNAVYKDCTVPHKALYNKIIEQSTCLLCAIRAGNLDMIKLLIAHGADVNAFHKLTDWPPFNDRPLFQAIYSEYHNGVQFLLESGADPALKNRSGFNCFQYALFNQEHECAKLFIEMSEITPENCTNGCAEHKIGIEFGRDLDSIKVLVKHKFNPNDFFYIKLDDINDVLEMKYLMKCTAKDASLETIGYLLDNDVQFSDIYKIHNWANNTMNGNKKAVALAQKYGPNLSDASLEQDN